MNQDQTYLIRGGFDLSGCQQDCQFINAKIADADAPKGSVLASLVPRLDKPNSVADAVRCPCPLPSVRPHSPGLLGETCSLQGFHFGPSRWNIRPREIRVMDEVQIHIFNAELYADRSGANIPNAIRSWGE
jgi:hypothetical protein